jgi:hypothetical protein
MTILSFLLERNGELMPDTSREREGWKQYDKMLVHPLRSGGVYCSPDVLGPGSYTVHVNTHQHLEHVTDPARAAEAAARQMLAEGLAALPLDEEALEAAGFSAWQERARKSSTDTSVARAAVDAYLNHAGGTDG